MAMCVLQTAQSGASHGRRPAAAVSGPNRAPRYVKMRLPPGSTGRLPTPIPLEP